MPRWWCDACMNEMDSQAHSILDGRCSTRSCGARIELVMSERPYCNWPESFADDCTPQYRWNGELAWASMFVDAACAPCRDHAAVGGRL